jgi:hypothetical protein
MLGRRGSIPVTLLVILTVIIFGVALMLFSLNASRDTGDVEGFSAVEKFNLGVVAGEAQVVEVMERPYLYGYLGTPELKIRVEKLSEG